MIWPFYTPLVATGIDQENLRINGVEGLNMATGSGEMVPVGGLTLHGVGRSLSIGAMHRMTDAQVAFETGLSRDAAKLRWREQA